MELILINQNKLKIMLSAEDMSHYALTCDTIDYENTETRRALWDILNLAKHQTGFDAAAKRIYVQVYPSRCGGCEMYVTRMLHNSEGHAPSLSLRVRSGDETPDADDCALYRFDTLHDLLTVCERLHALAYAEQSTAYVDPESRQYYLVLPHYDTSDTPSALAFVHEFGYRCNEGAKLSYIREHGSCICAREAIEVLSALA